MHQRLFALSRTKEPSGAASIFFFFIANGFRSTNWAHVRHHKRRFFSRAAIGNHAHHFRNHIPGSAYHYGVAHHEPQLGNEIFIVKRGVTGTGQGGCPLLGEIICRATTPPTLEESYGSGPFGGSYEIIAGSKAETRVIHLPESDDPSLSTGGGYVNSGWVQLTMAPYNFTFVYDVEPTGTWK